MSLRAASRHLGVDLAVGRSAEGAPDAAPTRHAAGVSPRLCMMWCSITLAQRSHCALDDRRKESGLSALAIGTWNVKVPAVGVTLHGEELIECEAQRLALLASL